MSTSTMYAPDKNTFNLYGNRSLALTPDANAAGTVYTLADSSGTNSAQSYPIVPNTPLQIGPFDSQTSVLIVCTAGSVKVNNSSNYGPSTSSTVKVSQKIKAEMMRSSINGYLNPPAAAIGTAFSQGIQQCAEAPFGSMRIGIMNASGTAQAGIQCSVMSSSILGSGLPTNANGLTIASSLGFNTTTGGGVGAVVTRRPATQTINGVTSNLITLAAAPGGVDATVIGGANGGGTDCSITWTNPIVCPWTERAAGDGVGDKPVYWVFLEWPAGTNRTSLNMETFVGSGTAAGLGWNNEGVSGPAGVAPFGRPVRVISNKTNGMVSTPGHAYSTPCVREYLEWPAIIVEYTLVNAVGETLVLYCDSLGSGNEIEDVIFCGWARELQNLVSTRANPMSVCNLCVGGTTMDDFTRRINCTIGGLPNVNAYTRCISPNSLGSPATVGNVANTYASFSKNLQALNRPGVFILTGTVGPTNSLGSGAKGYGASWQDLIVPINNYYRTGPHLYVDEDLSVSTAPVLYNTAGVPSTDGSGQYWIKPGFYAPSGIHWTRAGHHQVAVDFAPKWAAA